MNTDGKKKNSLVCSYKGIFLTLFSLLYLEICLFCIPDHQVLLFECIVKQCGISDVRPTTTCAGYQRVGEFLTCHDKKGTKTAFEIKTDDISPPSLSFSSLCQHPYPQQDFPLEFIESKTFTAGSNLRK